MGQEVVPGPGSRVRRTVGAGLGWRHLQGEACTCPLGPSTHLLSFSLPGGGGPPFLVQEHLKAVFFSRSRQLLSSAALQTFTPISKPTLPKSQFYTGLLTLRDPVRRPCPVTGFPATPLSHLPFPTPLTQPWGVGAPAAGHGQSCGNVPLPPPRPLLNVCLEESQDLLVPVALLASWGKQRAPLA